MGGRGSFVLFLGVALGLHIGALVLFEPRFETTSGAPGVRVTAAGANAEIAALVDAWNTPPEVGEAEELAEVDVEETPPDTEAAEVADTEIQADATADDLGEHAGPGKEAVRPVMAKLPTPKKEAPRQIALRAPEPQSFNVASLGTPEPSSQSFGGGLSSPGGGLGSPSPAGSPSLGFTVPIEVEEEPPAPDVSPEPVPRPDAEELARREANPPDIPELEVLFEDDEDHEDETEPTSEPAAPSEIGALGGPGALPSLGSPGGGLLSAPRLPEPEPEEAATLPGDDAAEPPSILPLDGVDPQLDTEAAPDAEPETSVPDAPAPTSAVVPTARPAVPDPEAKQAPAERTAAVSAPPELPTDEPVLVRSLDVSPGEASSKDAVPSESEAGSELAAGVAEGLRMSYGAEIRAAIDRQKHYPPAARMRGEEGMVTLRIEVSASGALSEASISAPSGNNALDAAALDAAQRAAPFPAAPAELAEDRFSFVIPVRFSL